MRKGGKRVSCYRVSLVCYENITYNCCSWTLLESRSKWHGKICGRGRNIEKFKEIEKYEGKIKNEKFYIKINIIFLNIVFFNRISALKMKNN